MTTTAVRADKDLTGGMKMLTKEGCEKALDRIENEECLITEDDDVYLMHIVNLYKNELRTLRHLIYEHFDNNPIDWLKNCMGEEAFNVVFSSEEEVKKWVDRIKWHVKKVDELGRKLQELKSNPPLKLEELESGMWVWDNKEKMYIKYCNNYDTKEYGKGIRVQMGFDLVRYPYEENRFYRKQVDS